MKSARALLAAFVAACLAIVYALARMASRKTGKSIPASLPGVPDEAKRLASDVKSRTTETVSDIKGRLTGATHQPDAKPRDVAGEMAETESLGDYASAVDKDEVGT